MEKKYLNIVKYFILFFILGLNLIIIQNFHGKLENIYLIKIVCVSGYMNVTGYYYMNKEQIPENAIPYSYDLIAKDCSYGKYDNEQLFEIMKIILEN